MPQAKKLTPRPEQRIPPKPIEQYARDKVDDLMRRACLALASDFGMLARRIK